MLQLIIQAPRSPSQKVAIKRSPFKVGQSESNHLSLPRPELADLHFEIRANREGQAQIIPHHPVEFNGAPIGQAQSLNSGDRFQVGDLRFIFQNNMGQADQAASTNRGATLATEDSSAAPKPAAPSESFSTPHQSTSAPSTPPAPVSRKHQGPSEETIKWLTLQKLLHKELLDNLDLKKFDLNQSSESEMQLRCQQTLQKIIADLDPAPFQGVSIPDLIDDVIDQALGLGPLEDLLEDEEITEIMVNNFDKIYVERKGKLTLSDSQFLDNQQVVEVIRRIIAPIGRRIDETNPMVDARLQDGSRVNAIIPPLAISGPSITIRKFASDPFEIQDLIHFGSLTQAMSTFLGVCVEQRKNIVISGGTGSGKTTLLGVIARYIPDGDRIITIEDAAELKLPQDHVVSLESKPANLEGHGAIPIQKLVINSLRMRPDRIIVGECRGSEALDMLQAMNTGHDGSLTTLHANTCRDAISRLETMVMMAGMNLPSKAIVEQISSAVDVIVQTNRFPDGTRKISSISVVDGMEGDKVTLQEVFAYKMKGYDANGKVLGQYECEGGVPSFYRELQDRGISVDLSIFQ